jgi:glycosyltransferase involved in cell wall biosynthesis
MSASLTENQPELSVVIPVYNEEDNLSPLLVELEQVLRKIGRSFEVICVNDASTDSSLAKLQELQKERPWLRVANHIINSGESAAEATGFTNARAPIIITMDADQQNDPADIPALLASLGPSIAAVCGVRRIREDDWVRRQSSRIANWFRNSITGDRISDAGCTFRAVRKVALAEVLVFNGMHRFLPTILRLQGFQVVEILVNHRPRTRGQSKYGIGNRMWRGIKDCMGIRWYRGRSVRADRAGKIL